jgi:signal transduction histidine kinase
MASSGRGGRSAKTGSIFWRWFKNTVGMVSAVLVFMCSALLFAIQQSYYDTVRAALESAANDPNAPVVFMQSNGTLKQNGVTMLESFSRRSRMGVWLYDTTGKIVMSSDGSLNEDTEIPDELGASEGFGKTSIVSLPSGEQVMTLLTQLKDEDGNALGSVRYLVALHAINGQIFAIGGLMLAICVLALGIIIALGWHFARTISGPVAQLARVAERIAQGDMKTRAPVDTRSDELARLATTINLMADNLDESNRMKNDFVSTISHELRTPLTAIHGWSETLQSMGMQDSATLRRGLSIIFSESTRLGKMVEELLDFSRVQSGRLILNKTKLDVLAELDDVVFAAKENALRAGVTLHQRTLDFPTRMEGDADRLRQVFINIVDNAIKYNQAGGRVQVSAELLSPKELQISVEDNGCGIPQEHLPHVKEKFYKADTGVRGSGIGLAVADEIIRLHGGSLDIESAEGDGTKVTITLPIEEISLPELPGEINTLLEENLERKDEE